jgi:hypothetical protein
MDFSRSHQIKNRRFQMAEPAVCFYSLIRFPPLGLPNRFKGSPRHGGVSQPVQLPQQIQSYFTLSRGNVKLEKNAWVHDSGQLKTYQPSSLCSYLAAFFQSVWTKFSQRLGNPRDLK